MLTINSLICHIPLNGLLSCMYSKWGLESFKKKIVNIESRCFINNFKINQIAEIVEYRYLSLTYDNIMN